MKLHKRRPRIVGRGEVAARPLVSRSARSSAAEQAVDDDDQDPEMADCMDAADSSVSTRAPGSSSSPCSSMLSPLSGKENAGDDGSTAAAPSRPASAPEAGGAQGQGQQQKPKRQVTLLPSVFEGRPPVILFHYTDACGAKQRPMERAVLADIDGPRIFYSHTDAVHEYNAVVNILRQGGLYRVRPDTQRWLLLWSKHPPPETLRALKPAQKTNHFRGSWHLGRKDLIWKSLSKMQRRFGKSYHITPQAYVLPKAFMSWEAARIRQPNGLWIWKPCSQSCGRGIKVFSSNMSPDEVKELGRKRGVIQRYVPNPLLIFGYKFDLRIYVVIVSYDPLKVYINDEGLVRLATAKYSADPETLEQQTMHLTNYSVNKASPLFVQNRDGKDGAEAVANTNCDDVGPGASKWSLGELRAHFKRQGLDYNAMFVCSQSLPLRAAAPGEEFLTAMAQAKLQISIISAHNLYNADGFLAGKSDPYVICEVPGQPEMRFKTPVINNNLNPVWNHVGEIAGFMDGDTLEFQVWDSDTFPKPDQLLGKAMLTAADFYPQGLEGPLQLSESKSADAMLTVRVIVLETTDPQDPNMMQQEGVEYQEQVEYTQDGMVIQQEQMIPQQAFSGPQTLHVNVICARGLYNADGFLAGKSDPYCICLVPEKKRSKFTTKTINNCLDPDWNHTGLIHNFEAGDSLEFQVWDSDTFPKPDQLLGKVTLSPQDFDNNPGGIEGQLQLSGGLSKDCGVLEVRIVVDAAATIEDAQQAAEQEAAHSQHGGASQTHAAAGGVQPGVKRLSVGSQHLDKLAGAKMAKLKVTVFSASGLYNADGFLAGKSDPYVLCHVPENKLQKFKTKVLGNTLDPTWNHLGVINGFVVGHTLELIVYDSDTPPKPDQELGKVVLNSDDFFPYGLEGTLELAESKAVGATISVRIEVMPDTKDTGLVGVRPGVHTGATYQMQYGQPVRPAPVYYQQAGGLSGSIQYVSGGTYTTGQTYTYSTAASVPVAQAAFDAIDANHDGVITRSEFATAMAEPVTAQPIATKVEYASSTPVTYTTTAAQPQVVTYAAQPMPATTTVTMPMQQEPVMGATYTTAASPVAATSQEIGTSKVSYVTMAPAQPVVSSTVAASPMTTVAPATTYTMAPTTIAAPAASTAVSYMQQAAPAPVVKPATTVTMPAVTAPAQPVTSMTMAPTVTMPQPTAAVASSVVMQPQPVVQSGSSSIAAAATTMAPAVTIASQPTTITSQPAAASYRVSGTPATLGAATYAMAAPPTTVTAPATTMQPMTTYAAAPTTTVGAPATTYTAAPTYMTSGMVQGARVNYGAPAYTMAPTTYAAPGAVTTVAAGSANLFDRLDKNHDGVLSKTEFAAALR